MIANVTSVPGLNVGVDPAREPEVRDQMDQLQQTLQNAHGTLSLLEERLGYVTTPKAGEAQAKGASPMPTRSPLAHHIACMVQEGRSLITRTEEIYRSLEI